MKYILVLLTIISFAFGQDTKVGYTEGTTESRELNDLEMLEYERYQKPFDEKGLIQVTFNDVDTYFPTMLSYEIYAEECYNDKKEIDEDNWCLSTFPEYSVYNEMWGIVYLHRTPTFPGFIKWLERRIK